MVAVASGFLVFCNSDGRAVGAAGPSAVWTAFAPPPCSHLPTRFPPHAQWRNVCCVMYTPVHVEGEANQRGGDYTRGARS